MKKLLQLMIIAGFTLPVTAFAQQTPNLGAAADYAVFTAAGAFSNTGITSVNGSVGTTLNSFSGLVQGDVIGEIHIADTTADRIALDVIAAYTSFNAIVGSPIVVSVTLGNNQVLTPNIYTTNAAAATLNGPLSLDAQNNPNAIFIFRIGGEFSSTTSASVTLINGAKWENVYWQIGGEVSLGDFTAFAGTMVVDGAIHLANNVSLSGRALSKAGAITLANNIVSIQPISTLPVKLVSFTAARQAGDVHLAWVTANEQNSTSFVIERSETATDHWTAIGTVAAVGHSINERRYGMTDQQVAAGTIYYRLRCNDQNGEYRYSNTVAVAVDGKTIQISGYPNPFQNMLSVNGAAAGSTIILTDFSGKQVSTMQANGADDRIATDQLATGVYLLSVKDPSGRLQSLKLTK